MNNVRSCGVVVVKEDKYLMLRNYDHWDFPKGKMDDGELPMQTALRETQEEAALTDFDFKWGEVFTETEPYGKFNKIARYYIAELKGGEPAILPNPHTGEIEHHEFRWVTYEEALALGRKRIANVVRWARQVQQPEVEVSL